MITGIKRYARVTGKRAKKKRHDIITKRVNARVERIVEAKAQAVAARQTTDAKPTIGFFETWRQKKWSFL